MPKMDLTNKMIRLTFRVEDATHLSKLAFYLGTDSLREQLPLAVPVTPPPRPTTCSPASGWSCISQWADVTGVVAPSTLSPVGVPSTTSGFTPTCRSPRTTTQRPVTFHLQAIELLPDTRTTFSRGAVSITFDDSYASVFSLAAPR